MDWRKLKRFKTMKKNSIRKNDLKVIEENAHYLDLKTLESWLWEAACILRGPIDAPKYKDYILPLIFLKRISDVFYDEITGLEQIYGNRELVEELIKSDHTLVRIYLPEVARWEFIRRHSTNLGELLTDVVRAVARENLKLSGVLDIVDFNATAAGQRILSDVHLKGLIDVLNKHKLGIKDVEPDILGRAYEYLLRKFAEGSGQSAGEFYTPREVAILMSHIIDPKPGNKIADPCCGSSGLLIKSHIRFIEKYGAQSKDYPEHFGQEIQPATYALSKMNVFIHDMEEANIQLGDSMARPAFQNNDGSLKTFDKVVANPMWNQNFDQSIYENDPYNRFIFGYPPSNTADWGWIQYMFKMLNLSGKMAVVLDTGAVSRGSGNEGRNRERDIRKEFVDKDLIESVILLPENLFYNTTAPGIILIINKKKKHKNEILIINASKEFEKGRPKNFLTDTNIQNIADSYLEWKTIEGLSVVVKNEEAIKNDYNLSPSRYVMQNGKDTTLSPEEAVAELLSGEKERKEADKKLNKVLRELGLI